MHVPGSRKNTVYDAGRKSWTEVMKKTKRTTKRTKTRAKKKTKKDTKSNESGRKQGKKWDEENCKLVFFRQDIKWTSVALEIQQSRTACQGLFRQNCRSKTARYGTALWLFHFHLRNMVPKKVGVYLVWTPMLAHQVPNKWKSTKKGAPCHYLPHEIVASTLRHYFFAAILCSATMDDNTCPGVTHENDT